jgi:hypothetical protein
MEGFPADLRDPKTPALSEAESEEARLRWRALKRWDRARRGVEVALILPLAAGVFLLALAQGSLREGTPLAERVWDPRRPGDAFLLLYPLGLAIALLGPYLLVRLRVRRELAAVGRLGVSPARALMALERPEGSEQRLRRQEELLRKPWWLIEISGAHLIWWLAFLILAWWVIPNPLPGDRSASAACDLLCRAFGPTMAVGAIGFVLKVFAPLRLLPRSGGHREVALYYRWWSGWTWPVIIALSPGILHIILTALGVKVT